MSKKIAQGLFNILGIFTVSALFGCIFLIYMQDRITQEVEVLSYKEQFQLVNDWKEVHRYDCPSLDLDGKGNLIETPKEQNPYLVDNLFRLTTEFNNNKWVEYGTAEYIKKRKCQVYSEALERIKEDSLYYIQRDKDKSNGERIEKELNNLNCK